MQLSLLRQQSALQHAEEQRRILEQDPKGTLPTFENMLMKHSLPSLRASAIEVIQINVGKLCNQTCTHCHVDAGPDRRESMTRETAEDVIAALSRSHASTLDITGGAPEMNPNFRFLVEQARYQGLRVIDRCNLTILMANGFRELPEFLAKHEVEIVASLPCYLEDNCDSQRGDGVFARSIEALNRLNALGYGREESDLKLTLVYNPTDTSLPPDQSELESVYRRELKQRYGVVFSELHTITNLPISRFLNDLLQNGKYDEYMRKLVDVFNPLTVDAVMCRSMLSVDWEGYLYDCDFNQMLAMKLDGDLPQHIRDFDADTLANRMIQTGRHCFGCTAGSGSSCQGAIR